MIGRSDFTGALVRRRFAAAAVGCLAIVAMPITKEDGASAATSYAQHAVLGSYKHSNGLSGWGQYRPSVIDDGADSYDPIKGIVWKQWGDPRSVGHGRRQKARGGATVELRVSRLGACQSAGHPAYGWMVIREKARHAQHYGPWGAVNYKNICKGFNR